MLIQQTLRYLPAQLIGPLAQFTAVLAWTHWLLPSEYGFVLLLLAIQELAFTLCMSWWTLFTMRYLPGLRDRRAYESTEYAVIMLAALAQAPVVLVAMAISDHFDSAAVVAATLVFTLSRTVNMHLAERARAIGDVVSFTIVTISGPVFGFLLGIALMEVWPNVIAVMMGFAVVQTAILPVLTWRFGLRYRPLGDMEPAMLRSALVYGVPLLAASGFGWVSVNGIRVIVERLDGFVVLGLMSVGWTLGQRLISVMATLMTAATFPLAVKQAAQAGLRAGVAQVGFTGILVLTVLLPSTVGLIAITEPLTRLFVGAAYQDATLVVLPLAALAAAIRNLRVHVADQVFLIMERPRLLMTLNAVEAGATMTLCAAGQIWGGFAGACLGALAGTTLAALACFVLASVKHDFRLPLGPVLRIAAATAAMALAIGLPPYPATAWGLALQVGVGAAVYAGFAAFLLRGSFRSEAAPLDLTARPEAL